MLLHTVYSGHVAFSMHTIWFVCIHQNLMDRKHDELNAAVLVGASCTSGGVGAHLLVDGRIEVVVHIQVHKLSAVVLGDHDVLAVILEGHSQRLPNAWHSSSEVLTEHLLHILCTCTTASNMTNLHILLLLFLVDYYCYYCYYPVI